MRYFGIVLKGGVLLCVLTFFLIIAFNNTHLVDFHLLARNRPFSLPLIALLFIFFVSGIVLGLLGMWGYTWKVKRRLAHARKQEKNLLSSLSEQQGNSLP